MHLEKVDKIPEGYQTVPGHPWIRINRAGTCINARTGNTLKPQSLDTGYEFVRLLNDDGTYKNYYIHRLLGITYLKRPAHLEAVPFDELEINHLDGDPGNNDLSNLQWCTPQENIEHALAMGLKPSQVVQARNVFDNTIKNFISADRAAKEFGVNVIRLRRHLKSPLAGLVTKNGYVFKYATQDKWPTLRDSHYVENSWDMQFGKWIATNVDDQEKIVIGHTLKDVCDTIGIDAGVASTMLARKPRGTPHKDWVIIYDELYLNEVVQEARRFAGREIFPPKKVRVWDMDSDMYYDFDSRNEAAKGMGIHPDRLRYAVKINHGSLGRYLITES